MERIGIFGGTFDPVHYGHLRMAWEVKEALSLSRVIFVVSNVAPHKEAGAHAAAQDRLAMVRAAIQGVPGFEVSDVEVDRPGPSYTVETLKALSGRGELYFLVGADAFLEIHTWRAFPDFLQLARFVVASRPGAGVLSRLEAYLEERLPGCYADGGRRGLAPRKAGFLPVRKAEVTPLEISSTLVRGLRARGRSPIFLTPPAVAAIMEEKGLYGGR